MTRRESKQFNHEQQTFENNFRDDIIKEYLSTVGKKRLPPLWEMRNALIDIDDINKYSRKQIELLYVIEGFEFWDQCSI